MRRLPRVERRFLGVGGGRYTVRGTRYAVRGGETLGKRIGQARFGWGAIRFLAVDLGAGEAILVCVIE